MASSHRISDFTLRIGADRVDGEVGVTALFVIAEANVEQKVRRHMEHVAEAEGEDDARKRAER